MELTREHFRRRLSRQDCIDELKSLFGDKAANYDTVKNWFNEFNCGRRSLKYEVREGPPKTAVVSEKIDALRELMMQDRHVTYREIEASLHISSTSIHSILHKLLTVKRFVLVGSCTIGQTLKKGSCRLVQRNVGQIRWQCFKISL